MKTAKEWLGQTEADIAKWKEGGLTLLPASQGTHEWVEAIQADARERGRREGIEEAAKACVGLTKLFVGRDDALGAQYACVEAIRKLAKESGVGDG